jgi:hypothetical protein
MTNRNGSPQDVHADSLEARTEMARTLSALLHCAWPVGAPEREGAGAMPAEPLLADLETALAAAAQRMRWSGDGETVGAEEEGLYEALLDSVLRILLHLQVSSLPRPCVEKGFLSLSPLSRPLFLALSFSPPLSRPLFLALSFSLSFSLSLSRSLALSLSLSLSLLFSLGPSPTAAA